MIFSCNYHQFRVCNGSTWRDRLAEDGQKRVILFIVRKYLWLHDVGDRKPLKDPQQGQDMIRFVFYKDYFAGNVEDILESNVTCESIANNTWNQVAWRAWRKGKRKD